LVLHPSLRKSHESHNPEAPKSEHGTCKTNVRENGHGSSPPEIISEVNVQKLGYPSNRQAFQPHRYIQDKTCREMARDGIQAFLVHWSTPGAVTECGEEKRVINLPYCSFQAVSLTLSGAVTECGEEEELFNLPYCFFQVVSITLSTNRRNRVW